MISPEGAKSCVIDNGAMSDWFPLEQSVRQGGILSTWLYLLYIDELLDNLHELGVGAKIEDSDCGSPCHADDLTLVTLSKFGLDSMMSCCGKYSVKWRYDYNGDKCIVIVFGENAREWYRLKPLRTWRLGNKTVMEVSDCVHLGIIQDKFCQSSKRTIAAVQKLKSTLMSILGPGIQPAGFNPISSFKLYQSVCIPAALYGSEIWDSPSEKERMMLERAHRFCLKRMQGFARTTRTAVAQAMIGSLSIQAYGQ